MSKPVFLNDNLPAPRTQRGISRYFENLKEAVAGEFPGQVALCSATPNDHSSFKFYPSLRFKGSYRLHLHDRIATLAARLEKPRVVYSPYFGVIRTTAAEIFTIYDMIPEKIWLPENNSRVNRRFVLERQACFVRAAAILAISESTARDFKSIYPTLGHKVVVTPLGVDAFFFEEPVAQAGEPPATSAALAEKPYFLYVGTRTPYKNFITLLAAYGQSGLASDFDLRVISPGLAGFNAEETGLIQKWRLADKVQLFRAVGDEELRGNYAGAAAFIYPSKYEGFGLPILEAFASGTLVATSNISSMPEVGGEAAFYFDPTRPESIAATLKQIAELSGEDRQNRLANGLTRARTFSWGKSQAKTAELFRRFV
jgi:glycosyltransferase involved in cell wall biosynthesis